MATLAALTAGLSCGTDNTGLEPASDAGAAGSGKLPTCFQGTIDLADWPAGANYTSCSMICGPDNLGVRTCSQIDLTTCGKMSGCVCLASPCTTCASCAFLPLPDCYVPSNAATAPTCAATVVKGGPCAPSCDRILCIEADGKTGCLCNADGKYACAEWSGTTWK